VDARSLSAYGDAAPGVYLRHLSQAGSGAREGCILAPNTLQQAFHIRELIFYLLTVDPFLMTICGPVGCQSIARIYTIADGGRPTRGVHAPALAISVPGPGVEVFD
jgi:hypothetical protein